LRTALAELRAAGRSVGLVPTMGALHEGHLSLVRASAKQCDATVVTIFVNPTQFGPGEDFSRYPRDLDKDLELLADHRASLVFAPDVETMYGPGHETYIDVGPSAAVLDGAFRPGHFRGVATIVLKLFQLIPADVAFFGRKDYQQCLVIRRMVADLDVPIRIEVMPIVREADGLAMSSRNAYLSDEERRRALSLSEALAIARRMYAEGEHSAGRIRVAMEAHLRTAGRAEIDYVALVRDGTVEEMTTIDGPTAVLIAAQIGQTRLIDNGLLEE
jgi:pantoate--beta-alanine ligase